MGASNTGRWVNRLLPSAGMFNSRDSALFLICISRLLGISHAAVSLAQAFLEISPLWQPALVFFGSRFSARMWRMDGTI